METPERCFHCGEPLPAAVSAESILTVERDGELLPVCCSGCQAVSALILHSGLGRYYRFREDLGRQASEDSEALIEAWRRCDQREGLQGEDLGNGRRELLLQTEGIRCAACAWLIRSHLEKRPGVESVQVDTATGYTRIIWRPEETRLSRIAASLLELGYLPHLPLGEGAERARQAERRDSMKRLGVAGLGMMQVMMYAVGLYAGDAHGMSSAERGFLEWVSLLVTFPVVLYSGRIFFQRAWLSLRRGRPGMDVPVALAIGLAFLFSCINFFSGSGEVWFDSVVMFIFFLTFGRHIELVLRQKNMQAGAALARLLPEWAQRQTDTGWEMIPASDLQSGDCLQVPAGEAFPADGIVLLGSSEADESLLSGESRPRVKQAGDRVIAGSINLSQPLEIEVTAGGGENTVSMLGRLLIRAQTQRDEDSGLPSWLVPAFTVAVVLLAGGTWLGWQAVDPVMAFPAALSVLVASCPCALSLALPASQAAACRRLLGEGILLTRGGALSVLTTIQHAVFDKTGTLTLGRPAIDSVELNPERPEFSEQRVLDVAAAIETRSAHPVSRAFRDACPLPETEVSDVTVVAGQGLSARQGSTEWTIGQSGLSGSADPQSAGIYLADERGWVARFILSDQLRPGAVEAVRDLRADGVVLHLYSGDDHETVRGVADQLGIEDWQGRLTPAGKQIAVAELKSRNQVVLMVGDGANDAPVLATADVSMTVKGGAELANSAADLILTGDSLDLLGTARQVARRTRQVIRQNLGWALLYNAAVVPLAITGTLTPWMAALGMSLSSLLVVANASRLARERPRS